MTESSSHVLIPKEQQRLIQMLDYLESWDRLNRTPTFDVIDHQGGLVIWESDLQGLKGIHLRPADASGDIWLQVERLFATKPPAPPSEITPWVVVSDIPDVPPSYLESIPDPDKKDPLLLFEDQEGLEAVFEAYKAGPWQKWADAEKPRRQCIALYERLFNLLQTIETEGSESAMELVWGMGVALWLKDGRRIRYPIVSRLVEIDPVGVDMSLRIRVRTVPPILETDVFAALEIPNLAAYEKSARRVLENPEIEINPFDESTFGQILADAVSKLAHGARVWDKKEQESLKIPSLSNDLTITNTWVLFSRRKGTNFLIEDIRRLKKAVEDEKELEGAAKILVQDLAGEVPEMRQRQWLGLSSSSLSIEGILSEEPESTVDQQLLYFPKPFNNEQVQIIDRLENSNGVVVQGPPGTGKTHTIANVICHYLAQGKRVLVTSKGEPALSVLREKLPKAVQNLTVSLLTSERDGLKQLEQSVSKISTEISNLNKAELKKDIDHDHKRIDVLHSKIMSIERELGVWAKKNINPVPPSLDSLRPHELAKYVLENQETFSWFPDQFDDGKDHDLRFTSDDISRLQSARSVVGGNIIYSKTPLPEVETLPTSTRIAELHAELQHFDSLTAAIEEQSLSAIRVANGALVEAAILLRDELLVCADFEKDLLGDWAKWVKKNFHVGRNPMHAFTVVQTITAELADLVQNRKQFFGVEVNWSEEWDSDEELLLAIKNAALEKAPFGDSWSDWAVDFVGLTPATRKLARERFNSITLNGRAPKEVNDWKWVEALARLRRNSKPILVRWNSLRAESPVPELPIDPIEGLRVAEQMLERMENIKNVVTCLHPSIELHYNSVFKDPLNQHLLDDPEGMRRLAGALDVRVKRYQLQAARKTLADLKVLFRGVDLPVFNSFTIFLENKLGQSSISLKEIEDLWQPLLDDLSALHALKGYFSTIEDVCSLIKESGAVNWAEKLSSEPDQKGSFNWTPDNWDQAWKWSRQFGFIKSIDNRQHMQDLSEQRFKLQGDLSKAYSGVIEKLTWMKLRETLDKDAGLMPALQSYMNAIQSIGAGTGVRAPRFRRDARNAMSKAHLAIRCWIMPHWRVSESLPSDLGIFDLVIVDEASQSDLWALPAILRAKRILVVGDDKQVSPTVFAQETDILQLHSRFLRDLPFGADLTPDKSLYDFAKVAFATNQVELREHFRSVEPIINFSNSLCYNGNIRCLRVPTANERITPPLVDVFVKNGRRAGVDKANINEAKAIVEEIRSLVSDPAFKGKSIGVVSLIGKKQAALIYQLLSNEIGIEKMLEHSIHCGDASNFQGREADIVFLSLVSCKETVTPHGFTGIEATQRVNVAASRARDRLYLYRSFERSDLSPADKLRAALLDHFAAPLQRDPEKKGRERCESDFERAVFDRLHEAGYRITPQVPAGGYRIDMVVEGHYGRRLAVECDGDQYHAPDVWMRDLFRQRTLERAGWTFWRCWGSSFIQDPDACMQDLFNTLKKLEIEPLGSSDIDLSEIVHYREVIIPHAEEVDTDTNPLTQSASV
jgi:superfamily I DNA and/or RNA helicase